jgi:hypothetical protein
MPSWKLDGTLDIQSHHERESRSNLYRVHGRASRDLMEMAFYLYKFLPARVALLVLFGVIAFSCRSPRRDGSMFKVTSAKSDAQIEVDSRGDEAIIRLTSPSGIGSAEVEITSEALPKRIVLQFHLRGLEELRFAYDATVVTGSLASTPPHQLRQSVREGGNSMQEQIVTANSPHWMRVRIVVKNGSSKIPLPDGYFEVEAPEDFIKGKHRKFSIH